MTTLRSILALFAVLLLAACTNPFQPDDRNGNPPDPEDNGNQDQRQGSAPDLFEIPVYFV